MTDLLLKRTGPTGDTYAVFAEDQVVGYIRLSSTAQIATPWIWTLAYGQHEDRTPSHGYEATREAAMQAFAKSWHRERMPTTFKCPDSSSDLIMIIMLAAASSISAWSLGRYFFALAFASAAAVAALRSV